MTLDKFEAGRSDFVFLTIGAFGYEEESFFRTLLEANIDTFCDLRQRRGVRGSRYAFVNSKRLQSRLAKLNVRYVHIKSLAPTQEVRRAQKEADKSAGVAKRQRESLHPAFVTAYRSECLKRTRAADVLASLPADAKRVALFCVEELPSACHRSLAAKWLADHTKATVEHLTP
jgi:uncharacterized protein (DUF488 family)